MIINLRTADYLTRVIAEIETGRGTIPLTDRCPECGEKVDHTDLESTDKHMVYMTTSDTPVALVACEGYWMVDPSLVGLPRGNWQDYLEDLINGDFSNI